MRLIDIPVSEHITTENWVIGANKVLGTITGYSSVPSGIEFIQLINIRWAGGRDAQYNYPDDCPALTVDESMLPSKLSGYTDYQVGQLEKHIDYMKQHMVVLD